MIATVFLIFAFLRSIRWSRRSRPIDDLALAAQTITSTNGNGASPYASCGGSSRRIQSQFSRSDSSATTTSSSGITFMAGKMRGDSTASTTSTSVFSDNLLPDGSRRSSEGIRLVGGHRRSSGRLRKYVPRTSLSGTRRRTTGRLEMSYFDIFCDVIFSFL